MSRRTSRLRKRVVEEWRGLPDIPPEPTGFIPVADALRKVLAQLGLNERLNEHEVTLAWREIVGDFLADHSAPASMRDGILTIHVLQPSVRYELDRSWKAEILHKLQKRFGPKIIKDVRFRC